MNSINTNVGALLAQKFLRSVSTELVVTQNRLSSGLRVSSVTDDASTFAVASGMRGDIKAYTAVAAALQGSVAAVNVAVAAGETISTRLGDIEAKIVQLSSNALSQSERDTYNTDIASLVAEVNSYLLQATYNGNNLLGVGGADMQVVANVDGSTLTLRDNNVADLAVGPINNNGQAVQGLKLVEDFRLVLDAALANLGADLARARPARPSSSGARRRRCASASVPWWTRTSRSSPRGSIPSRRASNSPCRHLASPTRRRRCCSASSSPPEASGSFFRLAAGIAGFCGQEMPCRMAQALDQFRQVID